MPYAFVLATLATLAPATPLATADEERPNVVLIVADDQAWTDFGFMGHDVIETPALDALASQSLVFKRGYVPAALCRPSLATLATGLFPHQHGITGNDPPRGVEREALVRHIDASPTLPRLLAAAGYRCLQTGKWWEGSFARGGFTEGMTHGDSARGGRHGDEGLAIGRTTMRPVLDFMDDCRESEEPFLVWYAPFLPHRPHNPPERLLARYRAPDRPLPLARYYAMCAWFDETCGTLLEHLDATGLAEDTIVVLVSDNGWVQRADAAGYAPRSKRSSYDTGVRTPIVIRWPRRIRAGERDEPVSTIDVLPTLLAACGVEAPEGLPGVDLLDPEPTQPRRVFGARCTHDVVDVSDPARGCLDRWILADPWKLIVPTGLTGSGEAADPAGDVPDAPQLYDLRADPGELLDRAGDQPEVVARLTAELDAWWPARPRPRPNILLIVTDDQRADALGCAGHPVLQTPNLDRLAGQGVRFRNAFVTTAICAASRASMLCSRSEGAHGFTFGTPPLARAHTRTSYPALLRAAGYRTGFVGKWGMRTEAKPREELFDVFRPMSPAPYLKPQADGSRRHLTDLTADAALAFLAEGDVGPARPFCLTVSFNAPHADDGDPAQYVPPTDLDELYADAELPPPPLSEPGFFAALPEFQRTSLNRVRWGWRFDTEEKRQRMTKNYYRMITGTDRAVGRILAELETRELASSTVVIFTSDNGYFLGERGFAGKWTIHDLSIRVPLIVRDPRLPAGRSGAASDAMVLNLDVPATIVDVAGLARPESYEGQSLLPLARGASPPWRSDFLYEHRFDHAQIPKSVGVRGERWVYARYDEQEPAYEELYDLSIDPLQAVNLALDPAHAADLVRMRGRCSALLSLR